MNRKLAVLTLAGLVAIVATPRRLSADSAPDAAAIYKSKCAMCHGPDGAGQTPTGKSMKVRDLRSAAVQKLSESDLINIIANGKGKMPAYKAKLSAAEIDAVGNFVRAMGKK